MDRIVEEDEEAESRSRRATSSRAHVRPSTAGGSKRRVTVKKDDKSHRKSRAAEPKPLPDKSRASNKLSSAKDDAGRKVSNLTPSQSIQAIRTKPSSLIVSENVAAAHKKNRYSLIPGGRPGATGQPASGKLGGNNKFQKPLSAASSTAHSSVALSPSSREQSQGRTSSRSKKERGKSRSASRTERLSRAQMGKADEKSDRQSSKTEDAKKQPRSKPSKSSQRPSRSHSRSRQPSSSSRPDDKKRTHSSSVIGDKKNSMRESSREKHDAGKHGKHSSSQDARSHHKSIAPPTITLTTSSAHSTPSASHTEDETGRSTSADAGHRHRNDQHVAANKARSVAGTSADEMLIIKDHPISSVSVAASMEEKQRKKKLTKSASAHDSGRNNHATKPVRSSQIHKKQSLAPTDNVMEPRHLRQSHSKIDETASARQRADSRSKRASSQELAFTTEDDADDASRESSAKRSKSKKTTIKRNSSNTSDVKRVSSTAGDGNQERRKSSLRKAPAFISHRISGRRTTTEEDDDEQTDEDADGVERIKRKKRSHHGQSNITGSAKVATPELTAYLLQTLRTGLSKLKDRATTPSLDMLVSNLVDGLNSASKSADLQESPSADVDRKPSTMLDLTDRAARYEQRARMYRQSLQQVHTLVLQQLRSSAAVSQNQQQSARNKSTQRPSFTGQDDLSSGEQDRSNAPQNSTFDDTSLVKAFEHDLSLLINARNCEIASLKQQLERPSPQRQYGGAECGYQQQKFGFNDNNYNQLPSSTPDEYDVASALAAEAKLSELTRECADKCLEVEHYQKLATTWRTQLDRQCEKLRDVEALQTKMKSKDYEIERLRMQLESLERSTSRLLTAPNVKGESGGSVCRLLADAKTMSATGEGKKSASVDNNVFGASGTSDSTREADVKASVRMGEAKRRIKQLQSEICTLDAARRLYEKRCNEMVEQVAASRSQTSHAAFQLETFKQTVAEVRLENKRLVTLGGELQKKYAQDSQSLRAECKRVKSQYQQLELEHGQGAEDARQKHERLHDAQIELKQLEAQLRSVNQELNAVSAEADKRKKVADELKQQIQALDERLVERDTVSLQLREQLRAVEAELWQHRQRREQIEQAAQEHSLEKKRIQQLLQEHRAELDKKRQELTFIEGQAQEYKTQLEELESCIKTQFDELLANSQRQIKQASSDSKRHERKGNCLERAVNVVVNFILSGTMQKRISLHRPPIRKMLTLQPLSLPLAATSTPPPEPLSDERIARALGVNVQQLQEAARVNPNVRAKLAATFLSISSPNNYTYGNNVEMQQQNFDPNWPPQFAPHDVEQCRRFMQQILSRVSTEKTNNVEADDLGDTLSRFVIQLMEASVLSNVSLPTAALSGVNGGPQQGRTESIIRNSRQSGNSATFATETRQCPVAMETMFNKGGPNAEVDELVLKQRKLNEKLFPANAPLPSTSFPAHQPITNSSHRAKNQNNVPEDEDEMLVYGNGGGNNVNFEDPPDSLTGNDKNVGSYYAPNPTLLDVMTSSSNHYDAPAPYSNNIGGQQFNRNDDGIDPLLLGQLAAAMLSTPQHPTPSGTCIWGDRSNSVGRQSQGLLEPKGEVQVEQNTTSGWFIPVVTEQNVDSGRLENRISRRTTNDARMSAAPNANQLYSPNQGTTTARGPSYEQQRATRGSISGSSRPSATLGNTAPLQNYTLPAAFSRNSLAVSRQSARPSASDTGMNGLR